MTNATLKTDLKIGNLVVFFFKVGSKKCRGAPQCTLHIAKKVVSQCRGGLLKYGGAQCTLHIVEAISCTMQIARWFHNAGVGFLNVEVHNAHSKVVSQCRGGLFLPGLEGGAWWSSQEGRGRGTKELETQSLNSTPLTLHRT